MDTKKTMTMQEWYQGCDLTTVAADLWITAGASPDELQAIAADVSDLARVDFNVMLSNTLEFCERILAQLDAQAK